MIKPPIFFVSGLPRSGSTLLMNLLGQNPNHHVTPTNGLFDMMLGVRDRWTDVLSFKAQGHEVIEPRITKMLRGMIEGFYHDEFQGGKVVFDKSRAWLSYIEMLEEVLERPVTILVTVRDIRAIVASFEKLYQAHPILAPRYQVYTAGLTIEGRARVMLTEGLVGVTVNRLRDALRRRHKSDLLTISYDELCRDTRKVMEGIHEHLQLPKFTYDPDHVEQITYEDDSFHGLPLHSIRPKVEVLSDRPWEGILPPELCEQLVAEYPDIQQLADAR